MRFRKAMIEVIIPDSSAPEGEGREIELLGEDGPSWDLTWEDWQSWQNFLRHQWDAANSPNSEGANNG